MIKEEDAYLILGDYCSWNQPEKLRTLLAKCSSDIDVICEEGIYFDIALSHGYIEVLQVLLDYYEKTKLQGDKDSSEYRLNMCKLREILRDEVEGATLSEEISKLLKPYLGDEDKGGSDTDQDLSEYDGEDYLIWSNEENFGNLHFTSIAGSNDNETHKILGDVSTQIPTH